MKDYTYLIRPELANHAVEIFRKVVDRERKASGFTYLEVPPGLCVVLSRQGDFTIAEFYKAGRVPVSIGVSKCSKDDVYSQRVGVQVAAARAAHGWLTRARGLAQAAYCD